MLPIAPGVLPFGLIMGTVASESGLSFLKAAFLNLFVFAGASQLAALDLMNQKAPIAIVVLTGLIINLRFIMYSTSLAPLFSPYKTLKKLGLAYIVTDQSFAVSSLAFEDIKTNKSKVYYYIGASLTMALIWHFSVLLGYLFGDIAPKSLSLDFAVPLAFLSIVIPSIKTKKLLLVALCSSFLSILFYKIPLNLGLMISACLAVGLGVYLDSKTKDKT